ncbi:MAG: DUF1501 domain-containing protein [Phycisphaerales bacterium]
MSGSLHHNPSDASAWTRRQFVHSGLALASAAITVPHFIQRSAIAMPTTLGASSVAGVDEDKILVVVQLSGGNDGLNTVVPFNDDAYHRVRPSIALRGQDVLRLSGPGARDVGLHPALEGLGEMYDDGLMSVVQGVGYPNPNRSHFASMDIWHTGDTNGTGDGWLGRYVDHQCCGYGKGESGRADGSAEAPLAIGPDAPLALEGRRVKPVTFESAELFRWAAEGDKDVGDAYDRVTTTGPTDDAPADSAKSFLMRTALDARVASDTIRKAVAVQPLVRYPQTELGQQLQMVSAMIRAGMKTRVYYVSHGSFDTHAGQGAAQGQHANLLRQWGDAIRAFYNDLKAQENDKRVLTMSFSEFGRRVGQNASGGTDHGTAAPMFLFGPGVKPGVFGSQPSLTNLDEGDLKFGLDFRSVYANVLGDWLGADAREVLGQSFRATKLIRG